MILTFVLSLNFVFANDVNDTALTNSVNGDSFKDIQDAVDTSSENDTIYLNSNTYIGNGTQITVNKSLTIDGAGVNGGQKATLDANSLSRIFYINKSCHFVLKNIVFKNMYGLVSGSGIYHAGGNLTVNNCVVENLFINSTVSTSGMVVYAASYSNVSISNISLLDNYIESTGYVYGAFFYFNSNSFARMSNIYAYNNTVYSSKNYLYGGVVFVSTSSSLEVNNFISLNNTMLSYSKMYGGNILSHASNLTVRDILISKNRFISPDVIHNNHDMDGCGILSFYKSVNVFENYTFSHNFLNYTNPNQAPGGMGLFVNDLNSKTNISNCVVFNNTMYHSAAQIIEPLIPSKFPIQGVFRIGGSGILKNICFSNNVASGGMASLQLTPSIIGVPSIVENCTFINNLGASSSKDVNRTYFADHGAAICVSGGYNGMAIIRNSTFINNTNSQGGAITPHNNCIVEYCRFINNTATKFYGGAISTEDGLDRNNANVTIRYCYFEGNGAPIGGAIQAKGDNVDIYNCTFKDNDAVQGGAVFLEGNNLTLVNCTFIDNNATHNLDSRIITNVTYLPQVQVWNAYGGAVYIHGFNSKLKGNIFKYNSAIHTSDDSAEGKGGAIYIYGDNATLLLNYFDDNFAHSGNGSAIYVLGINSKIDGCEFYNHDSGRGTLFVRGSHAYVLNSIFKANTATRGGAGIYSIGNNSLVDGCLFENNNATIHGGAIHSHGDYILVVNSKFISNNAHPNDTDLDKGLGGAIYTKGDFNDIAHCEFDFNTARNGSAIYNRGNNLTIEDCNFHFNQAYSYNLFILVTPEVSNYSKSNKIIVNITHIGGDNIINAIYNDGDYKHIFFLNVTYEHSSIAGGKRNTGDVKINPVASAEESNNGELVYQDSREDLQVIDLIIAREIEADDVLGASISGEVVEKLTGRTGLYGNISFTLSSGLKPGKYNVYASHPDDKLYKGIQNNTRFEILPHVDLKITKSSDKDSYFVGDIATFKITVTSLGTDASNVIVNEILPESFKIIDAKASKGTFKNNVWSISNVALETSETLVLKVKLTKKGSFTNIVNVSTSDNDTDLSNNHANKTVKVKDFVDLKATKTANVKVIKVGGKVIWTITVTNQGTLNATNVKAIDRLSKSLKYLSYTSTKGTYNPSTGEWDIGDLNTGETATLTLTTKLLALGKITNSVSVTSNEKDVNKTNNYANFTVKAVNKSGNATNKSFKKDSTNFKADKTHATGNPLFMIVLALMAIVVSFKRKY